MAQNTLPEGHIRKAFESIKNNDPIAFKSLWPDRDIFCKIIDREKTGYPKEAQSAYCESNYYKLLNKVLDAFIEERHNYPDINWQDLYIHQVHMEKVTTSENELAERSGYLWLKSKNNSFNFLYRFTDMIRYANQWYGCIFNRLSSFDGNFEEAIRNKEESYETSANIATEAATAAAEAAMAAADAVADSTAAILPVLEQSQYSTTVNGKKIFLNWVVMGWESDRSYDRSEYQYQDKDSQPFDRIVAMENNYFLLVEYEHQNYFRLKKNINGFTGIYFSAHSGRETPVTFVSTEVKK